MTERVLIFDTTLRDGEQSPGASMTISEKLMLAEQLERLRVDRAAFASFQIDRSLAAAVFASNSADVMIARERFASPMALRILAAMVLASNSIAVPPVTASGAIDVM